MLDDMSAPTSQPPPPRRPTLLISILVALIVVLAVPYIAERVQYALARGKLRARADVAAEQLQKLSETAGLVTLADTSRVFSLVAQKVEPCVVHIDVEQPGDNGNEDLVFMMPPGRAAPLHGQGTGFIVDTKGYILTNRHVIRNATEIRVNLADGRTIDNVQLVGDDELTDLAVLKISASGLSAVDWGDSDDLDVGDWVLAVGNPYGLDRTVTSGIVSAKQRRKITQGTSYQDFLQTDAAVNPGNSGGPLVNLLGQVVGVNTAIVGRAFLGISFAIPSEVARNSYDQIIKNGHVERGYLGVGFEELDAQTAKQLELKDQHGAMVNEVVAGSPAEMAGIEQWDVILEWNGREVVDPTDMMLAVAGTEVGSKAKAVVWRRGQKISLDVTVGRRPDRIRMRRR